MRTFIIRRVIYGLAVVWLVSFIVFGLSRAAGDPRDLYIDEYTTTESWEAMGREMGLDKPLIVQYTLWFGNALTGDFGRSMYHRTSARAVIGERIKKNRINIFLIIVIYSWSILAAQYLNSGIFPYGSRAGFVNRLAAASL